MRPGRLDILSAEDISAEGQSQPTAANSAEWTPLELSAFQSFIRGLSNRMQEHESDLIIGELIAGAKPSTTSSSSSGGNSHRFNNFDFSWVQPPTNATTDSPPITTALQQSQSPTDSSSFVNNTQQAEPLSSPTTAVPTNATQHNSSSSNSGSTMAASIAIASNNSLAATATIRRSPYIANHLLNADHACDPFDAEHNMRVMDKLYNATFRDFIRNEENVMVVARHLISLIGKHEIKVIANGLRWVMDGWYLENVAKLLKLISRELLPDVCGLLVNLITLGWEVSEEQPTSGDENDVCGKRGGRWSRVRYTQRSSDLFQSYLKGSADWTMPALASLTDRADMSLKNPRNAILKLCAIMTAGEPAESTAVFVKSLTMYDNWGADRVTELVSFLDAVLEWDEVYFREFTEKYIDLVNEAFELMDEDMTSAAAAIVSSSPTAGSSSDSNNNSNNRNNNSNNQQRTGKISFDYLAALYKTNLALANYKMALADFKAAAAARAHYNPPTAGSSDYNRHHRVQRSSGAESADGSENGEIQRRSVTSMEDLFRERRRRRSTNSLNSSTISGEYSRRPSTNASSEVAEYDHHHHDANSALRLIGLLSEEPLLPTAAFSPSSAAAPYRHPPSYLSPTYRMRLDSTAEAEQYAERELELSRNGDQLLLLIEDTADEEDVGDVVDVEDDDGGDNGGTDNGSVERIMRRHNYNNPFRVAADSTSIDGQSNVDIALAAAADTVISRIHLMSDDSAPTTPSNDANDGDGFWSDALNLVRDHGESDG